MAANFSLRQLEYFVAVADTGSMSAAAVRCHASQASISTAIADLERRLGVQLLIRRRAKGVSLTEAGSRILGRAQAMLTQADEITAGARAEEGQLAGRLTVGCYAALTPFLIPLLVDGFTRHHPAVDLELIEGQPDEMRQALVQGSCDVALLYAFGGEAGLSCTTLRASRPYVIVAADHTVAGRGSVSLAELADEPLIIYAEPPAQQNAEHWFSLAGARPNIRYRTSSIEAVRSMVARGLGFATLIQTWPTDTSVEGLPLASVPLSDPLDDVELVIAHASHVVPTHRARAFLQYAEKTLARPGGPDTGG
ncbi:LysR family transcriptional regulator [Streptomyces europaeiscabiei]|uniref:LysR family transcriptional regulator n=1 Tax=Streptomyces europaeiscabiei TaxID=146819 RepID=A0AAJ2PIH3_9ACTN|nr:LysR family transcriptional regulator [Streptomyces europaeiscabiei]MDX3128373.1 LysR family transcriptional regulator [Streptomyces europaeiscabiei]